MHAMFGSAHLYDELGEGEAGRIAGQPAVAVTRLMFAPECRAGNRTVTT